MTSLPCEDIVMNHCENKTLNEQMRSLTINGGRQARLSNLSQVRITMEQSDCIMNQIEQQGLVDTFIKAVQSGMKADKLNVISAVSDILEMVLVPDQTRVLKAENQLILVIGLEPNDKYRPISYAGDKMGVVYDAATTLATLIVEAVMLLRDSVPVRVPGTHDRNDPCHYVSIINQVRGQEDKLTSGSIAEFGFHGDGDGFFVSFIEELYLVGQIPGKQPQGTIYSSFDFVQQVIKGTGEETKHIELLRKAIFVTETPGYTNDGKVEHTLAMPVLSDGDRIMRLHPTTKPYDGESPGLIEQGEKALAWLRNLLAETALSIALAPSQVLIMPNLQGKHGVGEKAIDESGLTDRQFIRIYGKRGYKPVGCHHILTQLK